MTKNEPTEGVLVLNPFNKNLISEKEGIFSLEMHKVFNIKKSEKKGFENPIQGKKIKGVVIDMRDLSKHLDKIERIKELIFVASKCKELEHQEVIIAGNKPFITDNFLLKENMKFTNDPWEAVALLN